MLGFLGGVLHLYFISFHLLNKPGLGMWIDPGLALTPFPSSIGRPFDREPSSLITRPDFQPGMLTDQFLGNRFDLTNINVEGEGGRTLQLK